MFLASVLYHYPRGKMLAGACVCRHVCFSFFAIPARVRDGLVGRALRLRGAMWPNGTQCGSGGDLV